MNGFAFTAKDGATVNKALKALCDFAADMSGRDALRHVYFEQDGEPDSNGTCRIIAAATDSTELAVVRFTACEVEGHVSFTVSAKDLKRAIPTARFLRMVEFPGEGRAYKDSVEVNSMTTCQRLDVTDSTALSVGKFKKLFKTESPINDFMRPRHVISEVRASDMVFNAARIEKFTKLAKAFGKDATFHVCMPKDETSTITFFGCSLADDARDEQVKQVRETDERFEKVKNIRKNCKCEWAGILMPIHFNQ